MQPRLVPKAEAAAYLHLTTAQFDNWVRNGIVPGPLKGRNGKVTRRYDLRAIDHALDRAAGIRQPATDDTPLERRRARKRASENEGHSPG